jgi:uncharacterized pyridoxal phosphate-containing UPF0001 family protein
VSAAVRAEKLGDVATEFDLIHSIDRAKKMGSISAIIAPDQLRSYVIAAVDRGVARELARTGASR